MNSEIRKRNPSPSPFYPLGVYKHPIHFSVPPYPPRQAKSCSLSVDSGGLLNLKIDFCHDKEN